MMMATGTDLTTNLEPYSLQKLAEYMRDGTWLDVRTEDGLLQRVRIVEMVVRVCGEDIVLRQEWLDANEEWCKQQFAVDSDVIWKVLPTNYRLEVVEPYGVEPLVPGPGLTTTAGYDRLVVEAATLNATTLYSTVDLGALLHKQSYENSHLLNVRHAVLVVVWERCDIDPLKLCKHFGYKSVQPLTTARWKVRRRPDGSFPDPPCRVAAINIGRQTDRALGQRTTRQWVKPEEMCTR